MERDRKTIKTNELGNTEGGEENYLKAKHIKRKVLFSFFQLYCWYWVRWGQRQEKEMVERKAQVQLWMKHHPSTEMCSSLLVYNCTQGLEQEAEGQESLLEPLGERDKRNGTKCKRRLDCTDVHACKTPASIDDYISYFVENFTTDDEANDLHKLLL